MECQQLSCLRELSGHLLETLGAHLHKDISCLNKMERCCRFNSYQIKEMYLTALKIDASNFSLLTTYSLQNYKRYGLKLGYDKEIFAHLEQSSREEKDYILPGLAICVYLSLGQLFNLDLELLEAKALGKIKAVPPEQEEEAKQRFVESLRQCELYENFLDRDQLFRIWNKLNDKIKEFKQREARHE